MNMHMRGLWSAVVVTCLALLGACPVVGRAEGFLHTRGQDIVDEAGNAVMLRGVGLGNWMLPEGYMWKFGSFGDRPRHIEKIVSDLIGEEQGAAFWKEWRANYITEKDIARIAELGYNSVRPSLNARLFLSEGDSPQYLEEGFALLDRLEADCKAHHLYLIIDMHAAPGGQTGTNIDDSVDDQPRLFMEKKYQDRLVDLWVKIAERYKDEPTVAAYDLLNEPLPKRTGADDKYGALLEPLYKRITAAIRVVDKKHMITLEGSNWAGDWSVFSKPFDDNLVYQFHYYCRAWPADLKSMEDYVTRREQLGAPVWVGEAGERSDGIYWASTELLESHNMGWSFWPWKKMDTDNTPYSIKEPAGWGKVVAYSRRGEGAKPSREEAQRIFDELIHNIQLANCEYFPDVVNAMFRRVPGVVQAEDYAQGGLNKGYFVREGAKPSAQYRKTELVPVELINPTEKDGASGQAIRLKMKEWTVYQVNSLEAKSYTLRIQVKKEVPAAAFRISINDADADHSQSVAIVGSGWHTLKLNPVNLKAGANTVKLAVQAGEISFDWMALE
jgi:endoglucanase